VLFRCLGCQLDIEYTSAENGRRLVGSTIEQQKGQSVEILARVIIGMYGSVEI
jgi:hypothetical protein